MVKSNNQEEMLQINFRQIITSLPKQPQILGEVIIQFKKLQDYNL